MSKIKKIVICIMLAIIILFLIIINQYSSKDTSEKIQNEVSDVAQNETIMEYSNIIENNIENENQNIVVNEGKENTNIVANKKEEKIEIESKEDIEQSQNLQKEDNYQIEEKNIEIQENIPKINNEIKKEEVKNKIQENAEIEVEKCTNSKNHGVEAGNTEKWYNTKEEAIEVYNKIIS